MRAVTFVVFRRDRLSISEIEHPLLERGSLSYTRPGDLHARNLFT